MFLDDLDNTAMELGLDIENYYCKWKQAKKMAISTDKRDYPEENAFQLACRLFIELGGEKIKPSTETKEVLKKILDELLGTSNLTTGAIPISQGFASIKLASVVSEYNIRMVFRKFGVEQAVKVEDHRARK